MVLCGDDVIILVKGNFLQPISDIIQSSLDMLFPGKADTINRKAQKIEFRASFNGRYSTGIND